MKTYPLHGHQLSYDALLHENEMLKRANARLQAEVTRLKGVLSEDHRKEETGR